MRMVLALYLLFGVHVSACSNGNDENNAGTSGLKPAENAVLNSDVNLQNTPGSSAETPSPNPRDVVIFDGKNYIKKSGWKTPPKKDTYVDESYDQGDVMYLTESGKRVRKNTVLYGYRTSWWHSQEFYYDRGDLDYLKGKLEAVAFMEISANGKVFMHSITVGKVVRLSSNNLDHQDPFGYRIQDRDGDGIFETLLPDESGIVVPNWVLK
jgi:hypothetical protein